MKRIVIFNINENYGGAETSFLNLMTAAENLEVGKIVVVARSGSKFYEAAGNVSNVELVEVGCFNPIEYDKYLFIFNGQMLRLFEVRYGFLPYDLRLWLMHPDEFHAYYAKGYYRIKQVFGSKFASVYFYLNSLIKKKNENEKIEKIVQSGVVFLMDGACSYQYNKALKVLGFNSKLLPFNYLPVTTGIDAKFIVKNRSISEVKSVFYFGRVEDFKTKAVFRLIEDIASSSIEQLHIIGAGKDLSRVKKFASVKGVDLICHGFLEQRVALELLNEKADMAFAMGISALLCAQASIPVVILNPCIKSGVERTLNFLYEEVEWGVGDMLDNDIRVEKSQVLRNFGEVVVNTNSDWSGVSEKTYNKVKEYSMETFENKVKSFLC